MSLESRTLALEKARAALIADSDEQKASFARRTEDITNSNKLRNVSARFKTQTLESNTDLAMYGLKSRDEWNNAQQGLKKRKDLAQLGPDEDADDGDDGDEDSQEARTRRRKKEKAARKRRKKEVKLVKSSKSLLSFGIDEEEDGGEKKDYKRGNEEEENALIGVKVIKNPTIDTTFLPDREREQAERKRIKALKREWLLEQDRIKTEKIKVTCSYWDGSGHRREVTITKGTTVERFLEVVRQGLIKDFPHLRTISADSLMYIKEDLIIPQDVTFYDMIVSQARGKTGPLFAFDVHEDISVSGGGVVQADSSHAGKVLERHWYERNRHIYPASNWELLDLSADYAELARKAAAPGGI